MEQGNKLFNKYIYKGAIHIHSTFSDGTGTIEEISIAAKKAGLDFIVVTDHNCFEAKEGIYNGVYVFKGEEISPENQNHYLAIDIPSAIAPSDNPQEYIEEVRNCGGFGFAAHPDEYNKRKNKAPAINWIDKSIEPDGVEIWNWFSSWADGYDSSSPLTAIYSFLFRNKVVHAPKKDTLVWWDFLNNKYNHIVPCLGGVDAHALKRTDYIIPVTIFPYEFLFKTVTNLLFLDQKLSNDFELAKKQIFSAFKKGNNIIINRKIDDFIPEVYIENSVGKFYVGENISLDDETFLNVKIPYNLNVAILLNGIEVLKFNKQEYKFKISELGKYRVEIRKDNKGFIYTNPISVVS